ncbi:MULTISPECIES: galactose-6-phosphate isomerase subunit LacA [unclassified Streptococcus]|uniref:galactose-6-phosphate isomerase subunit LacA n=1 Tax=unclassified Streptococcus TaxID=2608887 RepID=UPI0018AB0726|nr:MULTISPECIES: galactose-6-phosphate isomerase subunit LacA [unclassified Streptococcus]MBF8969963.1 galactose-6-phosphate isomerase subunit LacA [Streptococcus sp. NLN76]MBG9368224.1 galactose-6-phosphate isomerase subunit LacA [Streptococcus sp. NLN64]
MRVIVGADPAGKGLLEEVQSHLESLGYQVLDVSQGVDFVDTTLAVVQELLTDPEALGLVVDAFGQGPFMVATKVKGMVAAVVSDERSAYMTREHNNARLLTFGSEVLGSSLAKNIALNFVEGHYDGGRHQIRVDMLNKMC